MIQLRWLPGQGLLQYRTWKIRIDASGAMSPLPLPIEWTPWETVDVGDPKNNDSPFDINN